MIDGTDKDRFSVDAEILQGLLAHPDLANKAIPLLIILNKNDESNFIGKASVEPFLALSRPKDFPEMPIMFRECCGRTGSGVGDCFSAISSKFLKRS